MISSHAARVWLAAFVASTASCGRAGCGANVAPAAPAPLAISVEVAGCAAVRKGPICELTPATRELNLWIQAPPESQLEVKFGDVAATPAKKKEIDGGTLLVVPVPDAQPGAPAATPVVIIATSGGARGEHTVNAERVPSDESLDRVQALRKAGKLDEAARAMPPVDSFPEPLRGRAKSLSARLALAAGRADEAIEGLRASMAIHRKDGRISDEVHDAMALAHTLLRHGRRVSDARTALESAEIVASSWHEGIPQLAYYKALVARDAGDFRGALREFRVTDQVSRRLGLDGFRRRAEQPAANLMQVLGDNESALAKLREIERELPAGVPACERAEAMTNRGWAELVALRSPSAPSPMAPVDRSRSEPFRGGPVAAHSAATRPDQPSAAAALSSFESTLTFWEESCPKHDSIAIARVNLALAAVEAGDLALAESTVQAIRAVRQLPSYVALWLLDVEARVALARHDARVALSRFKELTTRAEAAYTPEPRWRGTVGMGTALEALGDTQGAESAYRRGEELLDEQSMSVPLSDGRASFLGGRDSSAQLLVDLLTRRGDGPGALATVRTARVRALRAAQRLDRVAALPADVRRRWEEGLSKYAREREAIEAESSADWSVPADRLASARDARRVREDAARAALDEAFRALAESAPPVVAHRSPVEGELLIAFQPSADGRRIHAFTQDSSQVAETTLEPIPSDATEAELADRILTPLAPRISAAKKLLVLSHGPLAGVDVHALPWRGAPLLAHMSVEYPADLPGATESPAGGSRERPRALVVSDTRDDLPQARGEAAAVSVALAPRWDARRLEGKDATRAAVLSQLETADLFHFASHASFDGSRGWDSALHLAHGTVLRTGDILALPRAPRVVVLSACESGRTAAGRVVDMSLAHAFIAAGSHVVIAAMRPVEDRLAAALVARTYQAAADPAWDVAESFRAAQVGAARAMHDTDWRAYRVITR